jgi:hypothetical protein
MNLRNYGRAVMLASWAAARTAGACFALYFVVMILFTPFHYVGKSTSADTASHLFGGLALLTSGLFWFAMVTPVAFAVAVPTSVVVGSTAHLLLRNSTWHTPVAFSLGGYGVGVLVWTPLVVGAPPDNMMFGHWLSAALIGGPAGVAGGYVFQYEVKRRRGGSLACA